MTPQAAPSGRDICQTDTKAIDVLLFCQSDPTTAATLDSWKNVVSIIPDLRMQVVNSIEQYRAALSQTGFKAVIFDWKPEDLVKLMLVPELKLCNETPGVLVVGEAHDPVTIATLYNAGCHRFIPKIEGWRTELVQALRGVLRAKRAEWAHERARARITEMLEMFEEKNRRLEEFSITLAHDVRGPLAGISMKLDYILDTFSGTLPDRASSFIQKALDSSRRLTNLVQAMYEYAKVGAKYQEFSKVDLELLVREVSEDLQIDERIDVQIGVEALPVVWGSKDLLRRVFQNLIQNAIKYCDKTDVRINIACEAIEDRALGRFARLTVVDNGPGIPVEARAHVFSLFARLENGIQKDRDSASSSKQRPTGMGAGLAVVQRIIELHFGKVWVADSDQSSGRQGGAKFVMVLPLEPVDLD